MRYMLRQKVLSLKDDFAIRDVDGNDVLQVKGQFFSLGKKLLITRQKSCHSDERLDRNC